MVYETMNANGFRISLHAQARRVERAIRDEHLAAALCASPTLHLSDRTAHYHDMASGVVVVCLVLPVRLCRPCHELWHELVAPMTWLASVRAKNGVAK